MIFAQTIPGSGPTDNEVVNQNLQLRPSSIFADIRPWDFGIVWYNICSCGNNSNWVVDEEPPNTSIGCK